MLNNTLSKIQDEKRLLENRLLSTTLDRLNDGHDLRYLAGLIHDHTHFREVLLTAPKGERYVKYEAMRPYLRFPARALSWYELPTKG